MKKALIKVFDFKNVLLFFVLNLVGPFFFNGYALPNVDSVCMAYHAVDFNMGFLSRVLPGHIFRTLFNNPTKHTATVYESVLYVLLSLSVAIILNRVLLSVEDKYKPLCFYFLCLFCLGHTLCIYYFELGMLDVYWVYAFVLFVLFFSKKYLWFLIPVIFVTMILIYFSSLMCYIPLMALIIIYEITVREDRKEKIYLTCVLVVSLVLTLAMFVYFLVNEKHNLVYDMNTFNSILKSRGTTYFDYYDEVFYKTYSIEGKTGELMNFTLITNDSFPPLIKSFVNIIARQIYLSFSIYAALTNVLLYNALILAAVMLPLLLIFFKCYCRLFKKTDSKLKKFVYFCAVFQFPLASLGATMSSDIIRWLTHAFTCSFVFFLYLLYKNKDDICEILKYYYDNSKISYRMLYALLVYITKFEPYW